MRVCCFRISKKPQKYDEGVFLGYQKTQKDDEGVYCRTSKKTQKYYEDVFFRTSKKHRKITRVYF